MTLVRAVIRGATVTAIREMTAAEMEDEGWGALCGWPPVVIVLDTGVRLFASMDEECNGPGTMCGTTKEGHSFYVTQER